MPKERRSPTSPDRPVVVVKPHRSAGWVAVCPSKGGCGRKFTSTASEKALQQVVGHAYPAHGWTEHTVRFQSPA